MLSLYLFIFTIKIICILAGAVFGFKLARIKIADTASNISIACGYSFSLLYQVVNAKDLVVLISMGKIATVSLLYASDKQIVLQILATLVYICFLYGTMRRYKFNYHNKNI